ncbi:MAG: cytochrome c [Acidobacteria bacterium]|nr:cytochrome c [Acidobacteriota bacterium]
MLEKRCQRCHRPGEAARPFLTYRDVRPWAKAIREAVLSRKMPPWFAESGSVRFANDPRPSDAEIAAIDAWVRAGAPEGKPSPSPPVHWTAAWNIPPPDLRLAMPEPVRVPARGELKYQFIILPLNLTEDRWVRAAEIRPGAREAVHHVVAYIREPAHDWLRDAPAGKPFSHAGTTTSDILALYAPGQQPMTCLPGMAKKIPAGSDLVLQIHYTPAGRVLEDRTSIGLVWARHAPDKRVLTLQIAATELRIPPGERDHRVSASGTLPNDCLLLGLFPHMHLRGKAFEYAVIEPGGRVETLLRVAPYDFYWQLCYQLATPLLLSKGTRLRVTAWYDNSPNNPRNPDPTAEVAYGEQSTEEMMVGFFDVAVPAGMDKAAFFVR